MDIKGANGKKHKNVHCPAKVFRTQGPLDVSFIIHVLVECQPYETNYINIVDKET